MTTIEMNVKNEDGHNPVWLIAHDAPEARSLESQGYGYTTKEGAITRLTASPMVNGFAVFKVVSTSRPLTTV